MEHTLRVRLEKKDYIALFLMLMNKRLAWIAAAPLLLAVPVGAVLLIIVSSRLSVNIFAVMLPYIGFVAILTFIFFLALTRPAIGQYKEGEKAHGNSFNFRLTDSGMLCSAGQNAAEYEYSQLNKALETKDYFFFFVNEGQACIFPKRQLDGEQTEFLRALLPKCALITEKELTKEFTPDQDSKNESKG